LTENKCGLSQKPMVFLSFKRNKNPDLSQKKTFFLFETLKIVL
jgi:hypothetical protein